jgi:hypothetical protein
MSILLVEAMLGTWNRCLALCCWLTERGRECVALLVEMPAGLPIGRVGYAGLAAFQAAVAGTVQFVLRI